MTKKEFIKKWIVFIEELDIPNEQIIEYAIDMSIDLHSVIGALDQTKVCDHYFPSTKKGHELCEFCGKIKK